MRPALLAVLLLLLPAPLAWAALPAAPAAESTLAPECSLLPPQDAALCAVALHAAQVLCEVLFFWWPAIPPVCVQVA